MADATLEMAVIESTGARKRYLRESLPIPKTTLWRHKKPPVPEASDKVFMKGRKLYCRYPLDVPRQTKYNWKFSGPSGSEEYENAYSCEENVHEKTMLEETEDVEAIVDHNLQMSKVAISSIGCSHTKSKNEETIGDCDSKVASCSEEEIDNEDANSYCDDVVVSSCKEDFQRNFLLEGSENCEEAIDNNSDNESDVYEEDGDEMLMDGCVLSLQQSSERPQALYEGAALDRMDSCIAINQFATVHRLSETAIKQLLDLIELHCLPNSSIPRTIHQLRKHLKVTEGIQMFYFCSVCLEEITAYSQSCSKRGCKAVKSDICYFAVLPFEEHLAWICEDNWEHLQYPFNRKHDLDTLHDIQDGNMYKELTQSGGFLSVPEHIGLLLCCDGIPVFKSSGLQLWPVELCIANLPPKIRYDVAYLMVGALWLGPVKPDMNTILKPVLTKIDDLSKHGRIIKIQDHMKCMKAKLLLAAFDFPAKAMAMNFMQFNGRYGCPYCCDEGTHKMHRRIYLPDDLHEPRSSDDVAEWASQAEEIGMPVYGVKGKSILSKYIDIVSCIPIDYMHAVLEGVVKQFLNCWFGTENSRCLYYIRPFLHEIDKMLLRIKPLHSFRQSPRSIEKCLHFWKASEFRAWLLYYSLPVLKNFLPQQYLNHWSLLVCSMHLLLKTSITKEELKMASDQLVTFYSQSAYLYPDTVCTANMHSLIHVCSFVQYWGPLWCYSTFGYENLNGFLLRQSHGTGNILPQIYRSLNIRQKLKTMKCNSEPVMSERSATYFSKYDITFSSKAHIEMQMKVKNVDLTDDEKMALQGLGINPCNPVATVDRLQLQHEVLHCRKDKLRRNSSVCEVQKNDEVLFISVQRLCAVEKKWYAIGNVMERTHESILEYDNHNRSLERINEYIHKVKKMSLSKRMVAVPVEGIRRICVHVPLKYSSTDYIIYQPNEYEHH